MTSAAFLDLPQCPKCENRAAVNVLPFSAVNTIHTWYLRCWACGHVWTIPKAPKAPPRPIVSSVSHQ
jgi:uncharacterized Zn finger protein